jgi:hypothetical protein
VKTVTSGPFLQKRCLDRPPAKGRRHGAYIGDQGKQVRLRKHVGNRFQDALAAAMSHKPVVHNGNPRLFERRYGLRCNMQWSNAGIVLDISRHFN